MKEWHQRGGRDHCGKLLAIVLLSWHNEYSIEGRCRIRN